MLGHCTPADVRAEVTRRDAASGWANRILWPLVRRSRLLPSGGRFHEVDLEPVASVLAAALEAAQSRGHVRRDAAAEKRWAEVYERLSSPPDTMHGEITARAAAHVLRLSLIYALLDGSARIRPVHLEAALEVWRYCDESARIIFGDRTGHVLADDLLAELRRRSDGLTRTEIYDLLGRNTARPKIHKALELLAQHGLATMTRTPAGPKGGRPTERWHAVTTDNASPANGKVYTDNTRARDSETDTPIHMNTVYTDNTYVSTEDNGHPENTPLSPASKNCENPPPRENRENPDPF